MPTVHVRITEGADRSQKSEIVRQMTDTLVTTLGKRPEHSHVTIEEISEENWGFSGMLTDEYRANHTKKEG